MQVSITQSFCSKGQRQWVPCVNIIKDEDAKKMTLNEVVSEVLEYKGQVSLVWIRAKLKDDQEMVQLIRVLAEGGLQIVVYTDSADDITSFAKFKNIHFSVEFLIPNEEAKNISHVSLNTLREFDEIVVSTEEKEGLEFCIKALKAKLFTRPEIVFLVPEEMNSLVMKNKFTCGIRVINI